jgi:Phage integrase, N-terminal SAM-like domain
MTEERVTPLRQRMIEDMRIRGMGDKAQKSHIRVIKEFAAFLGRSPDTATPEDLRAYQLHMAARAEDLLPVECFHVVFTLPAEIAQIAYWNKWAVYGLLFKASAETVMTIAADPKRMGARVGMTSVLHTWGSASC